MLHSLKQVVFRLSPKEASFDRRGFESADAMIRSSLEEILRVFIAGYNLTLQIRGHELLVQKLEDEFDSHHVGFAFEGAGMCCALFDLLAPCGTSRLREFTDTVACKHDYITTVGAGFAVARLPYGLRVLDRYNEKLDPMVAWCIPEGYGFHQGFFHHRSFVEECKEPAGAWAPYARQLFDSGIGRSLWWVKGGSPGRIKQAINRFPQPRRGEMWHGVGIASSYAGGVAEPGLLELLELSGVYRADFLSGIPFSARMRQKGANPSAATNLACRALLKGTVDQAADLIVQHLGEISEKWKGTQRELGINGYILVRQRLTQGFQVEAEVKSKEP
jgi:enediyne biosynthesis protein E3